ncbi:MAG: histidine kinase, partial [Bacteroidota bacterium]
ISQLRVTGLLHDHHGRIWFGSNGGGLGLIDAEGLRTFLPVDGLPTSLVRALDLDPHGDVWVATPKGLCRVTASAPNRTDIRLQTFTTRDGLLSDEINDLVATDSLIYLGTGRGLCFFDPRSNFTAGPPPQIYLEQVTAGTRDLLRIEQPELPFGGNEIQFRMQGLSFRHGSALLYRHKLEGLEGDWSVGAERVVTYEALPPGSYTFVAQAAAHQGTWSAPARFAFVIRVPFWRTTWFLVLVFAGLLGLATLVFVVRLRFVRSRAALQMRIVETEQQALRAQMNPHFIFNSMNAIQKLILQSREKEALDYLSTFGKLLRQMLHHARSHTISLADELRLLQNYLEIEALRLDADFSFKLEVAPEIFPEEWGLPPSLVQPVVENAIWHGLLPSERPGKVLVRFEREGDALLCTVEDNGIGRAAAAQRRAANATHVSLGLEMIRERLRLAGKAKGAPEGVLEMEDLYDEAGQAAGTRVRIRFPGANSI